MNGKCHFALATTRVILDLLEANVAKVGVWDVSDKDPLDLEDPFPFVGGPHRAASRIVDLNDRDYHKGTMRW